MMMFIVDNPSLKVGWVAASLGGTGTDIYVSGGSMLGAIEGLVANYKTANGRGNYI